MRAFIRTYYAVAALTVVGAACLPWTVPLSYRVLGLDPRLMDSETYPAFQARMATHSLIAGFLSGLLPLALCLVVLSIAVLVVRVRGGKDVAWPVIALTTMGGAFVAALALAGLTMQGGGMCC